MTFPERTSIATLCTIGHFTNKSIAEALGGRTKILAARPEKTRHDQHLRAGADWLMRSIAVCGGEASSKGYRFPYGWMPPYPETTGYIIPTLLNLSDETGKVEYKAAAQRMGQWLTTIQRPDGGFCGYELGAAQDADVFDTGMILLGFNALIHQSETTIIAHAAAQASRFLRDALDTDGAFSCHVSHGILHTYNVRSAWALVAYGRLVHDNASITAGLSNVEWTVRQQRKNGFFDNNGFKPGGNANTHGTAYVMRGLLQVYFLTQRQDILQAVLLAADALIDRFSTEGWLASELSPDWDFLSRHICLSGCVQLAIVFFRLGALTDNQRFITAAERLTAQVAATQSLILPDAQHHGAIAGSYPVFGGYAPLQYPNWATKFMVDALLLRKALKNGERKLRDRDLYAG